MLGTLGPPGIYRSFALSPDGRRAVAERFGSEPGQSHLWLFDGERDVPTRLTFDAWQESCLVWARQPQFSPDGRYIAFPSSESGEPQLYVLSLGPGRTKWQVSRNAGGRAHWRSDGREIVYITPGRTMMSVEVDPGPPFRLGRERVLFTNAAIERCAECGDASTAMFAMTPDAGRFLVMQRVQPEPMPVTVVLNWTASIVPDP